MITDANGQAHKGAGKGGGQFATEAHGEAADTTLTDRTGLPDGPMQLVAFDIDGQFGPLVGYDDGRRVNGFAEPWLTNDSLARVKAATGAWAEVDSEVEWLDDGPDGVWRLHGGGCEPRPLEVSYNVGPHLEDLHRLTGWCFEGHELGRDHDGAPWSWADEAPDPADRPHPTRSVVTGDGCVVRPTAVDSEYALFVTTLDGALWRASGVGIWEDADVSDTVQGDPSRRPADKAQAARVRAAAVSAAPRLLAAARHRVG
jgi:hypothetical protein